MQNELQCAALCKTINKNLYSNKQIQGMLQDNYNMQKKNKQQIKQNIF